VLLPALNELNLRESFYHATDFNFQLNSFFCNLGDDTDHLTIINVHQIIWLEVPLETVLIDSESSCI